MLRLIYLSFFISSLASASEVLHSIGVGYSYSDIKNDSSEVTSELNDTITSHYSVSYQYKVSEYFSIGFGYLQGDSSHAVGVADIFTDSKIDYSATLFSSAVNYPMSKRNYLYLETSLLEFDYDVIDDSKVVYNEGGRDFSYSFGWGYTFDNGMGIKAGYEKLNLGEHVDIGGFNTTINYRF
jgi:hypothetical protein